MIKSNSNQAKTESARTSKAKKSLQSREFPILNKIHHERNALEEPKDQANNDQPDSNGTGSNWRVHLFIVIIIGGCALFLSPILLYPQHNSIQHPQYWYESMISGCLSVIMTTSLDALISLKYYFREDSMVSFEVFIILYITSASVSALSYSIAHVLWTVGLEYNHPTPFMLVGGYIQYSVLGSICRFSV